MSLLTACLKRAFFLLLLTRALTSFGQTDIFQLMERTDLSLSEIERQADLYFQQNGTGPGSGYKHYQRWLYERRFHTDGQGMFIAPETEDKAYYDALRKMQVASRAGFQWKELGPDRWTYTSGWNPGVGRLTSVAVCESDTNLIYVSSPGGGIWKSTDGGKSWISLIDFVNSGWLNVFHMCIDPQNTNVVYAALTNGGVIKTTNGGTTWTATGSGPSNTRQVRIFPGRSNLVFAAAGNGIYRSVNAGQTWTRVETATKEDIEFNPANPAIMFASGNGGSRYVWRSVDSGKTWKGIDSAAGMFRMGRTMIAVTAANPARVYVAQASGSVFGRFYRSDDTGKTFTVVKLGNASKGTNYFGYTSDGRGTTGQATYDMAIVASPDNADEVYIAGIIVWKTISAGDSFYALTDWSYPNGRGYNHADVHGLEWVKETLYSVSDGGLYKSLNRGSDFIDLSTGLGIRQFYRLSCAKTDPEVVVTGAQDNGSSYRKPGGSWVDWLGADGMDNLISPTDANVVYGTSQNGGIYKTTNGGNSYMGLSKPANGNWVTPLAIHPSDHDTLWGGWTGVYRSDDGGFTWNKIAKSISVTMDALAVAPSNPRFIYASKGSSLYRLVDAGDTWTRVTAPASITSIFVSKYNPQKIWITCNSSSNRAFVSENGGDSFINISAGLPALSARSVVVDEDAAMTMYVGLNIGVYYQDTITKKWNEHATGLPLVAINEIEMQKSGAKLRVATYGRGVWESDLRNVALPCNAPDFLTVDNVTNNTARISWSAEARASAYRVDYKKTIDTGWLISKVSTIHTRDTIVGLQPGTSYQFRVRSICGAAGAYATSSFTTGGTNAVRSMVNHQELNLYPDPVSDMFNLRAVLPAAGTAELKILEITGKAVGGGRYPVKSGENKLSMDVSALPPGQYLLLIQSGSYSGSLMFRVGR